MITERQKASETLVCNPTVMRLIGRQYSNALIRSKRIKSQIKQDRPCSFNVTSRCVRATTVAVEKQLSITYSEYVFLALAIQHAIYMCHIAICGLPRSIGFFPLYLINGMIFEKKKKLLNVKYVFWFSLQRFFPPRNFSLLRTAERDTIINVYWSSCKVPVIHVRY